MAKHDTNVRLREPYLWNVNVDQSNADTVDGGFEAKEGQQSTDVLQQEGRMSTHENLLLFVSSSEDRVTVV